MLEVVQHDKPNGDIEQAKSYHGETHHGTRAEGNLKTCVEALAGCVSGTSAGIGGSLHSEEASQTGEETTREECKRHPGVLHAESIGHEGEQGSQGDEHVEHHLVLLFQICHSAIAHVLCNFTHARCALVSLDHTLKEIPGHAQCHDRGHGN